jgi:hypothetical protein
MNTVIPVFLTQLQGSQVRDDDTFQNCELKRRLSEAESRRKSIEQRWKERFAELEGRARESTETIKQRHNVELREFHDKWDHPETLLPFQKPSVSLLRLRKMQKSFALANDFVGARYFRTSSQRLKTEESREATMRAAGSMRLEYEAMIEKHRKDVEGSKQYWDRKRAELECEKAAELETNGNIIKGLKNKLAEAKIPKRSAVFLPITTEGPQFLSARTRTMIADFRFQSDAVKLDVRNASVKSFARLQARTPRKISSAGK